MDDNKHILEEPAAVYGRKVRMSELEFTPMPNMMETLRKQGYISQEEFIERFSKFM